VNLAAVRRAAGALAAVTALVFLAACGGGEEATPPTPTPAQGPLDVLRSALDALNRGDIDGVYANLSQEARQNIKREDLRQVISGLQAAGTRLSITIDRVDKQTVAGDVAEVSLTLRVQLGETVLPLDDVASFVLEEGQWRIADHFLETGLTAAGLARPPVGGPRQLGPDGCATGDVLQGVYASSRLQVLDPCVTASGTVRDVSHETDGDITFRLELSGNDRRLLNEGNQRNQGGALQVEIVPLDQERIPAPEPGDRVRVTGAWVLDAVHGHNEIHPVFRIGPAEE